MSTPLPFPGRVEAGRALAVELDPRAGDDVLVLGIPPGGVVVASEIARALGAPLDVFVVQPLSVPGNEAVAIGALASGGVRILDEPRLDELALDDERIALAAAADGNELKRRERLWRGEHGPVDPADRTVVLVDDGDTPPVLLRAAVAGVRAQRPRRVIVATPVARDWLDVVVVGQADEVVCVAEATEEELPTAYEELALPDEEELAARHRASVTSDWPAGSSTAPGSAQAG
ncbi:MAG: phosphoribosyltransferase family protein [Thermoleophilia bacterium]